MINRYLQNSSELDKRNKLQDQKYFLTCFKTTYYTTNHTSAYLIKFSGMFLEEHNQCGQQHPSTVYYMELLNKTPDLDETTYVTGGRGLNKFGVVLVGDGKTNKHLMNIKKQYNTALQKFLLFPGDWHILKNFQPKIYYAAGLREIAKFQAIMEAH